MACTVRVVLHDTAEDEPSYKRLHEQMRVQGFTRFIESDGLWYRLPHAEYRYEAVASPQVVAAKATLAANAAGSLKSLLVSETNTAVWFCGLEVVTPLLMVLG